MPLPKVLTEKSLLRWEVSATDVATPRDDDEIGFCVGSYRGYRNRCEHQPDGRNPDTSRSQSSLRTKQMPVLPGLQWITVCWCRHLHEENRR